MNNIYTISNDHKPELELERIEDNGGVVYNSNGPYRVLPGKLSVSRSFGDNYAKLISLGGKPNIVIAVPEITKFTLTDKDDFILLGSN